jgi:hypothetical protein
VPPSATYLLHVLGCVRTAAVAVAALQRPHLPAAVDGPGAPCWSRDGPRGNRRMPFHPIAAQTPAYSLAASLAAGRKKLWGGKASGGWGKTDHGVEGRAGGRADGCTCRSTSRH